MKLIPFEYRLLFSKEERKAYTLSITRYDTRQPIEQRHSPQLIANVTCKC